MNKEYLKKNMLLTKEKGETVAKGIAANAGKNDILERLPVLFHGGYEACWKCGDADYDTQRGEDNDFCCVICHNPNCPEHEKHKE